MTEVGDDGVKLPRSGPVILRFFKLFPGPAGRCPGPRVP